MHEWANNSAVQACKLQRDVHVLVARSATPRTLARAAEKPPNGCAGARAVAALPLATVAGSRCCAPACHAVVEGSCTTTR